MPCFLWLEATALDMARPMSPTHTHQSSTHSGVPTIVFALSPCGSLKTSHTTRQVLGCLENFTIKVIYLSITFLVAMQVFSTNNTDRFFTRIFHELPGRSPLKRSPCFPMESRDLNSFHISNFSITMIRLHDKDKLRKK